MAFLGAPQVSGRKRELEGWAATHPTRWGQWEAGHPQHHFLWVAEHPNTFLAWLKAAQQAQAQAEQRAAASAAAAAQAQAEYEAKQRAKAKAEAEALSGGATIASFNNQGTAAGSPSPLFEDWVQSHSHLIHGAWQWAGHLLKTNIDEKRAILQHLHKPLFHSPLSTYLPTHPQPEEGHGEATGGGGGGGGGGGSGSDIAIGEVHWHQIRKIAGHHHWGNAQVGDWINVIRVESGGIRTAQNPTSSAYGIAQFIEGASEYYTHGGNPNTVVGQLTAMANYIAERYGTPSQAWAHELADKFY
ncbi:MAG: hypothetical protein ACRDX8_08815 [Acidimicrobiales bacterium]